MTRLTDTLSAYVSSKGELGKGRSSTLKSRKELQDRLRIDMQDSRRALAVWGVLNVMVFGFLLVDASKHVVEPTYVSLPAACAGLFWILRRVESVWRELRLQGLALSVAAVTDDEDALKKMMATLNAALISELQNKAKADERVDQAALGAAAGVDKGKP